MSYTIVKKFGYELVYEIKEFRGLNNKTENFTHVLNQLHFYTRKYNKKFRVWSFKRWALCLLEDVNEHIETKIRYWSRRKQTYVWLY